MNIPNDAVAGSNQATIKVAKRDDGQYEARCPNYPSLGTLDAPSEEQAIRRMSDKVRLFMLKGFKGST